jgi:hypothetical protein
MTACCQLKEPRGRAVDLAGGLLKPACLHVLAAERCRVRDVEAILDAHYLGRDVKLAEIAVMKLETRTKL